MDATFVQSILNMSSILTGTVVEATLDVNSCDSAFTSTSLENKAEQSTIFVDVVPTEDLSQISYSLKITGIVFAAVQGIACVFFAAWTIHYRGHGVVKKSHPIFLLLLLLGCSLMTLSILPTLVQAEYRYEQDAFTGEQTTVPNKNVARADAACMAFPWCFNIGFGAIFSALFAKIWRI